MIVRPKYRGPDLPTTLAVSMTAAASGSSGITVADDDDIDFGTGDFTIHWEGALPDWSQATSARLWNKFQVTGTRVSAAINTTGRLSLYCQVGGAEYVNETTPASIESVLSAGQNAKLTYVCTRETASTAGSVAFYIKGALFDTQTIPAAATVSISNSGNGNISCSGVDGTGRLESTTRACYLYNRALSAADVLSLCNNGVAAADTGANQTILTSGTLTVGKRYRIVSFVAGDNFTNVGASSNATGVEFVATGTTPTTWTNSSQLKTAGCMLQLEPSGLAASGLTWTDSSGNGNNGTLPAAGATKVSIRK